jgi:DNA repair protein RadD
MFKLRPYQQRGVDEALAYINDRADLSKAIEIAPTGAGKSLYIAAIANEVDFPIIVLQPSKELLKQNYDKYISYGNEASIYSASAKKRELGHVTFATIGSIIKEVEQIKTMGVKLVLIDEAHLQTKHSSLTAKFIKGIGVTKVIGFTATPIELRASMYGAFLMMITDSRKNIFNKIIHVTQIKEVVEQNYWAKIKYEEYKVDKKDLVLNSTGADYTENSLRKFFQANNLHEKVLAQVERLRAQGRKSILLFMPSIHEAEAICKIIDGCYAVSSNTPQTERDEIVTKFKNKEIDVVANVNILSVGFDHPELDAIIMLRPTQSFAIYYQQAGRGVRPHPNKKDLLIIDLSGNIKEFGTLENISFERKDDSWVMLSGNRRLTNKKIVPTLSNTIDNTYFEDLFKPKPMKIWFGKHNGKLVKDIPVDYLKWLMNGMIPPYSEKMKLFRKETERHLLRLQKA